MSRLAYAFGEKGSLAGRAAYALRKALGAIGSAPFTHLVAMCSIAVALLLGAVIGSATIGARTLLDSWSHRGELTLYLAPGTSPEDGARLLDRVQALAGGEATYVTSEEALARLALALGEPGQALLDLPRNPLPASIEVVPADRGAPEVAALAARLEPLEGVEEVDRGGAWAERITRLSGAMEAAGLVLLPLLLLGAAVLAGSVVRLAVHERRREIEILRLVGATDAFIRAPFLIEGLIAGLVGGLLAAIGLRILAAQVGAQLAFAIPAELDPLAFASPLRLALVVGVGAALGLIATAFSVERQLR